MPVSQPDHALGGAQPVERIVGEQPGDDLLAGRADARRPACGTRPGSACGTRSSPAGSRRSRSACPALARMGLDQLPADEELHHRAGDAHVGGLADVPPRHRVQHSCRPGRGCPGRSSPSPSGQHERAGRQRPQRVLLRCGEHRGRRGAVQRPARPLPGHLGAPPFGRGLHLRQRGELPAAPERVAHIRHRPFHPRLVRGPERPCRIGQEPVVRGQLGIGPVDFRVIQVRPVHPGLQVVRDQPGRHPAEELKRPDMALAPGLLVQPDHRPHEQVPRAGQHHHEGPHRDRLPGRRVQPAAQPPVIDLRLGARLRRPGPQYLHLRPAGLLRHVCRHIPAEAGDAHCQALLIPQPLMNRRDRDPGLELLTDIAVMRLDRRPGHLPQPGISQLREPLPDPGVPLRLAQRRPARYHPGGLRGRGILPYRLAVHAQRLRDLAVVPPRLPVDQDLDDVDHVERSPRHRASRPERSGLGGMLLLP